MILCYFVSDLHGNINKYKKLFNAIINEKPKLVLFGGDLLPRFYDKNFLKEFFLLQLQEIKQQLNENYPIFLVIFGNNDPKKEEKNITEISRNGYIHYIHFKKAEFFNYTFCGYSYSPPSPFLLKDWEKYDLSMEIENGCIRPEDGIHTVEDPINKSSLIIEDLEQLTSNVNLTKTIFLFHSPPYGTNLDVVANKNDKKFIHVGSKAIRKFIEEKQPYLTLHGHIHESARLSKNWRDKIGNTYCFTAAHDGEELCIIKFDLIYLENARKILI